MARIAIGDEKLSELIEKHLIPIYLDLRSVSAVCDLLNSRIPGSGRLYPNRLHSLFSVDPAQTVNEATVQLVQLAISGSPVDREQVAMSLRQLKPQVLAAWERTNRRRGAIATVAESVGIPPAVAQFVLAQDGVMSGETAGTGSGGSGGGGVKLPDWSFQDDAVRACLRELIATPNAKSAVVVPTGGSKTRIALRTAFAMLAQAADQSSKVLWVTHRKNLRSQAHRELQRMLSDGIPGLPANAAALLANRIDFIMVGQLDEALLIAPALVIIDEAHHAAAKTYQPVFNVPYPLRALFLTATPNRTDGLPLGIDSIAYTVTYRALADRGVILLPEFQDFPVTDFDWSPKSIADLADAVIDRAADSFTKTLVLAPRIDRVEEFYDALVARLEEVGEHPLSVDDIGFVHGRRNSRGCDNEEFLAIFAEKPRAILVSAQLLIEGFDDPAINAVVMTYPSTSLIQVMQGAGRCVRSAPGKKHAFVLQARNDSLAYYFDHRWLYQEISDELRPALVDIPYGSLQELRDEIVDILESHHVLAGNRSQVLTAINAMSPGQTCRVLLSGLPFFGKRDAFEKESEWVAFLETEQSSAEFRWVFNDYCARSLEISDPMDILAQHAQRFGFEKSFAMGSRWRQYADMLTSLCRARQELFGNGGHVADGKHRPFKPHGSTTWVKYVTFRFQPAVDPGLQEFLSDCHNVEQIICQYTADPVGFGYAAKLPLPLGRKQAFLFNAAESAAFDAFLDYFRTALSGVEPSKRFAAFAGAFQGAPAAALPMPVLLRIDRFLEEGGTGLLYPLSVSAESPVTTNQSTSSHDRRSD